MEGGAVPTSATIKGEGQGPLFLAHWKFLTPNMKDRSFYNLSNVAALIV